MLIQFHFFEKLTFYMKKTIIPILLMTLAAASSYAQKPVNIPEGPSKEDRLCVFCHII